MKKSTKMILLLAAIGGGALIYKRRRKPAPAPVAAPPPPAQLEEPEGAAKAMGASSLAGTSLDGNVFSTKRKRMGSLG